MGRFACAAALAFLSACAAPIPYKPGPLLPEVPAFDLAAHAAYQIAGNASIEGQAFMRRRDGAVVTCAGETVYAYPGTPFFAALAAYNAAGGPTAAVYGGSAAMAMARTARCDAQGNFRIAGLPPGVWLVSTRVRWNAGAVPQGGVLMRAASAHPDGSDRLLLTDADIIGQDTREK